MNPRPKAYESSALPLSYSGHRGGNLSRTTRLLSNGMRSPEEQIPRKPRPIRIVPAELFRQLNPVPSVVSSRTCLSRFLTLPLTSAGAQSLQTVWRQGRRILASRWLRLVLSNLANGPMNNLKETTGMERSLAGLPKEEPIHRQGVSVLVNAS